MTALAAAIPWVLNLAWSAVMADPPPPVASEGSLAGRTVHGYELVKLLGVGGMGEVYLARHLESAEPCAFKVIRADVIGHQTAAARFRREERALSQLHHTNIVHLLDHGRTDDGALFLAMPYVRGRSLQQVVDADGPMSQADALVVLLQLADALEHAHRRDIVHRDLKPQNVILQLDDPQKVRVIDFGLVKLLGAETATQLTADDQILGSPLYMSPEQGMTGTIGWQADIYALGGVGYFLLTGRPPFLAPAMPALILAHCYETPARPSELCPTRSLPSGLDELLLQCLAKDPAHRPRAQALVNAISTMLQALARPCAQSTPAPPGRSEPAAGPPIWSGERPGDDDSAEDRTLNALRNQITAMLLSAADAAGCDGLLERSTAARLDRIHALQESITNLEMEAALMDSQLEEAGPASSQELEHRLRELRGRAGDLDKQLRRELGALYGEVIAKRAELESARAGPQVARLEELVARYVRLTDSSRRR